ncbi:hypothetical protein GCM10010428_69290 [Actinosynnema pretiosum subsp. pretiosum]
MPPEVLERLRRRVLPTNHRAPVAAAAVVAALALGGVALTQEARDESPAERPPEVSTTSTTSTTTQHSPVSTPTAYELDKCGSASAEYVVALPSARLVVEEGAFCELAPTGVHRSTPADLPVPAGNGVRLRWVSETGVLVGELPAGAHEVTSATNPALRAAGEPAQLEALSHNGLFFVPLNHWTLVELSFDGGPAMTAQVPPELFARPAHTEVFPASRRAEPDQVAARCAYRAWLDGAAGTADLARWQPLVATTAQDDHLVVLRDGAGAVLECPTWEWTTESRFRRADGSARQGAFTALGRHSTIGSTTWFLTGVVDERATAVELTDAQGRPAAEVALENGWFAARFTDQVPQEQPDFTGYRVRVLAGQEVLHEGPATTG